MDTLLIGPPQTLVQNTVYALPARVVRVYPAAQVEVSHDSSTGFTALNTTTGYETSAVFIRATTANTVVSIKA